MNLKERAFNSLNLLPAFVGVALMRLNRYPKKIYGAETMRHKEKVEKRTFNQADLDTQLLNIANHAIRNVPYYRERYQNTHGNSQPNKTRLIESMDQFTELFACIEKSDITADWDAFLADDRSYENYVEGTTGGTTGKPMKVLMPGNRYIVELGSVLAQWGAYGFDFSPRAVLRNHRPRGAFAINPVTKEFQFNGFDLSDDNLALVYRTMKKYKLQYFQCYPSSGHEFANYLARNRCDTSFIKAFFASSEAVLPQQRLAVEALGIRYFSLYGHSEKLVMAGTCPESDVYHITPGYGFIELLDEQHQPVTEEGAIGEITGSTLRNMAFPLLRFRTGDYAQLTYIKCGCGYQGPAFKTVLGRWNGDRVYNRNGSFVTTTALNLHSDIYEVIDGLQYVQRAKGELIVRIIPTAKFNPGHESRFYEALQSAMHQDTTIEIQKVDQLERQSNGKFLFLISEVEH